MYSIQYSPVYCFNDVFLFITYLRVYIVRTQISLLLFYTNSLLFNILRRANSKCVNGVHYGSYLVVHVVVVVVHTQNLVQLLVDKSKRFILGYIYRKRRRALKQIRFRKSKLSDLFFRIINLLVVCMYMYGKYGTLKNCSFIQYI